jgi:hypothetical protein
MKITNTLGKVWAFILAALGASLLVSCVVAQSAPPPAALSSLSGGQITRIGQRIWKNECGGTVAGLTSWNAGEQFASLGIGHFIWYPAGQRGPFEESFPPLVAFFQSRGVALPSWLPGTRACPWPTREAFLADANGARQKDLRTLLSRTLREQTEFIMARSEAALPKMLAAAGSQRATVEQNYRALQRTPEGMFCLIDYVNFKGEGTNPAERYNGQGWGLLQVLADMRAGTPVEFAEAAKRVLSRRVANSPAARGEKRWLAGWHNRCDGYKRGL